MMRSPLALAVVVLLGVWCVQLVAAQDFQLCTFTDPTTGKKYDLKNLAKLYTSKASASDPDASGWKYYVSPCQPVRGESRCVATQSSTTVCQQDTKDVYALGTTSKGVVAGLPNGGEGFVVAYAAVNDRGSNISYICDPSAGEGKIKWTFIPAGTNPKPFIWTFQWRTSYACPIGAPTPSPSKGPSTNPAPPHKGSACCLYQFDSDPTMTRTLCATKCPPTFGGFALVSNWTVLPCTSDTCFFHKK